MPCETRLSRPVRMPPKAATDAAPSRAASPRCAPAPSLSFAPRVSRARREVRCQGPRVGGRVRRRRRAGSRVAKVRTRRQCGRSRRRRVHRVVGRAGWAKAVDFNDVRTAVAEREAARGSTTVLVSRREASNAAHQLRGASSRPRRTWPWRSGRGCAELPAGSLRSIRLWETDKKWAEVGERV